MNNNLTEFQIDALKETTNIGAGHAAIALSQMLNRKIMIAVTRSDIMPSDLFLKNMVGSKEQMVVSVYFRTLGDAIGIIIFMFKQESALKLCDILLSRKEGDTRFIDEKCQSAIKEASNILTGAFLSVISDMLKLRIFNQTPYYAFDKAEAIMYGVCNEAFGNNEERICIATEFIESSSRITGSFAFVPTNEAMDKLLEKLKAK